MELKQRIATVVDYDAWKRGYMPPSEHILIDQLAYRGATVNTATDVGDYAFWIVTRGFRPHGDKMFKVYELLHEIVMEELELKRAETAATKVKPAIVSYDDVVTAEQVRAIDEKLKPEFAGGDWKTVEKE